MLTTGPPGKSQVSVLLKEIGACGERCMHKDDYGNIVVSRNLKSMFICREVIKLWHILGMSDI